MTEWEKKVERMENNPRRKAKESRTREYYERQFPEIRKQREQQERFQRSSLPYDSNALSGTHVRQYCFSPTQLWGNILCKQSWRSVWLGSWPISIEDPVGDGVRCQAVIVPGIEVAGLPWIIGISLPLWNTTKTGERNIDLVFPKYSQDTFLLIKQKCLLL